MALETNHLEEPQIDHGRKFCVDTARFSLR